MKRTRAPCRLALACVLLLSPALDARPLEEGDIPAHPARLEFPPLEFEPPARADHRREIAGGVPVYVVEDHSLPLVEVEIVIRAGSYLDPEDHEGLASAVGNLLRTGGTEDMTPEEFDEEAAFLAADISSSIGDLEGSASFDCLEKDLDRVLDLFFDMLKRPRFDPSRLELYKRRVLQSLARRNDATRSIEEREWQRLIRGATHFSVDRVTQGSIQAIDREDLFSFHRGVFHPGNFIIAVSGDVTPADILERLEKRLAGWESPDLPAPPVPVPEHEPRPGVYMVDKPDVNQGRVVAGHLAVQRDHPDYHALQVMNHILGGGGFTSRVLSRVRSDEGLAYTAGTAYEFGLYYPGTFRAYFQSKSPSVARALAIVLEEIERIRREKPSREEVEDAINYWIGVFPRSFETPSRIASTFARDELTGRAPDFWETFREKIASVTPGDVFEAAREHLSPGSLVILVVGDAGAILSGDPEHPDASLEKIAGRAGIRKIPLPDPSTLEYPPE